MANTIKKYQPDRQDILWNTDWGIAETDVPEEEALQKGLVLYKGRWVTSSEYKILRGQLLRYRLLKLVAVIVAFAGFLFCWAYLSHASQVTGGGLFGCAFVIVLTLKIGKEVERFEDRRAWWAALVVLCVIPGFFVAALFLALDTTIRQIFAGSLDTSGPESNQDTTRTPGTCCAGCGRDDACPDETGDSYCPNCKEYVKDVAHRTAVVAPAVLNAVNSSSTGENAPSREQRLTSSTTDENALPVPESTPSPPAEVKQPAKTKINAKAVVQDIHSGLDDIALMQKYGLSAKQLTALFKKLEDAGLLGKERG